jgi:cysteine-rich repeat protein
MRQHILLVGLSALGAGGLVIAACQTDDPNQCVGENCGTQSVGPSGGSGPGSGGKGGGTPGSGGMTTGGGDGGTAAMGGSAPGSGGATTGGGDGGTSTTTTGSGGSGGGPPPPVCGDGKKNQVGEFCDDGNTKAGDGCSPTCKVEKDWTCDNSMPTVCKINGCNEAIATDMTGANPVTIPTAPGAPHCIKVKQMVKITHTASGAAGQPMLVGGTYDGAKNQDALSPIQPACAEQYPAASTPTCNNGASGGCINQTTCVKGNAAEPCCVYVNLDAGNNCYTGGCYVLQVGVYPFFDNSNPAANNGAIFVVP